MASITKTGKTVEEATQAALSELGVSLDDVTVEIIEEGNKGFFGLGGKDAEVRVTVNSLLPEQYAENFLKTILEAMNLNAQIVIEAGEDTMSIDIKGEDMGILIGRRGETLSALQYLTNLVVNKNVDGFYRVNIDTENYKKRREETLVRLANKLAGNAVKYRRNITLEPMSSYERRIIHSYLQDRDMITTYSIGEEPNRKVVIAYKGNKR